MKRITTCFILFAAIWINAQESQVEKRTQRLIKQLQQYEEKFENYRYEMEELREEVSDLRERLDEVETDERVSDLRDEVEELIDETQGEVMEERTYGLLSRVMGNNYINISGYFTLEYLNDNKDDSQGTFNLNRISFFFQKKFHRFNFFAEVEFEGAPKIAGEDNEVEDVRGEIVLEQAWVEYLHHPLLNIRMGEILVPEYYGTNFYPTTTFSTTDPIHSGELFVQEIIGVMLYGDTYDYFNVDYGVGYQFYISNGDGENLGVQDVNENKAIGAKFTFHLPSLDYFDVFDVATNIYWGQDGEDNQDLVWNLEFILESRNIFIHAEYASRRLDFVDPEEQLLKAYGGYVLLGYQFWDQYAAFARFEILDEDRRDEELVRRILWGIRYRPFPEISIKGEAFHQWHSDPEEEDFFGLAISFTMLL